MDVPGTMLELAQKVLAPDPVHGCFTAARGLSRLELGTIVAHHDTAFHHETDGAQRVDVLERIGIERVDVGVLACA